MNVSLYQAASALNANSRWQEMIAQNLSASSIPGYKRQDLSFAAIQAGLNSAAVNPANSRFVIPGAVTTTNFQQGDIKSTGGKTDLAIEGSGFFEVRLAQGTRAYTRDGEFHLNSQGELVTKQGHLDMGQSGPIQLDSTKDAAISVTPGGDVSQGSDTIGKIKVVDFNDPHLLTALGGGYFQAQAPNLSPIPAESAVLRQGCLESANCSPTADMADLITSMRMFEANHRVMSIQDERMGKTISELGSPT